MTRALILFLMIVGGAGMMLSAPVYGKRHPQAGKAVFWAGLVAGGVGVYYVLFPPNVLYYSAWVVVIPLFPAYALLKYLQDRGLVPWLPFHIDDDMRARPLNGPRPPEAPAHRDKPAPSHVAMDVRPTAPGLHATTHTRMVVGMDSRMRTVQAQHGAVPDRPASSPQVLREEAAKLLHLAMSNRIVVLLGAVLLIGLAVRFIHPGLTEKSTCKQFENASASEQDAVLSKMDAAHGGSSVGMTRLSLGFYCRLYPNRPINGIYRGD